MRSGFLLICLLLLANVQAAELYRSIDKDGKVHYSDTPLEGSEDYERLKLGKEPVPDENLPYETRRARDNFPVTLYTFPTCGSACQQARDMLDKRGIPYAEKSLVTKEEIDAFHQASGDSKLPAATVGRTWLKGFQAEQWNSELDFAGYPKTAPYRPAAAVKPAQ
ncbi:MAG: glutaredoxin family protein [Sideroxyarcus sp.]|nr:glutaredoxin family protein [Sideroxyarcus sp.]